MSRTNAKKDKSLPEDLVLGQNVRYYRDGWHIGRLDSFENGRGSIMPNPAYSKKEGNHITVAEVNIEPIEEISGQGD